MTISMKKLLFLFMMFGLFIACSDDDDKANELPVKGIEIPKFENPVKPGASITIKGEGFTKASEIWLRAITTRAENSGDVKAIITDVNSTGITFIAPAVYGNQLVLLKENGKEYELCKITFEEQIGESGDIEILSKKIKRVTVIDVYGDTHEEKDIYEYTYKDGKIISVKESEEGYIEISTYTYAADKITMLYKEFNGENVLVNKCTVTMDLKDDRLSFYTRLYDKKEDEDKEEIWKYEYKYNGEYLTFVKGDEDGAQTEETFSFVDGNFVTYKYVDDDYFDLYEYSYGNQLNNLNIDLFTFIAQNWDSWSGEDGFLLGVNGKRSKHLPSSMKWTSPVDNDEDEITSETETFEYAFTYEMDGDYITEMTITKEGEKETIIKIEYED